MKINSRRVIRTNCLPTRMPTAFLIAVWLLLDRFDASGWMWGVYWSFALITVIGVVISWMTEEETTLSGYGNKP